ncbi:carboxypeptidase-like regulatory domain-containing protein [Myxococcota bacterium]|nr:carboxypeptidase-like regulatory domain-containing protein [Myxococcota bacterium]
MRSLLFALFASSLVAGPARAGDIDGTTYAVIGSTATPVQSQVTLTGPENRQMNSNLSGYYRFNDLPTGDYTVTAVPLSQPSGSDLMGDCDTPLNIGQSLATCDVYMTQQ